MEERDVDRADTVQGAVGVEITDEQILVAVVEPEGRIVSEPVTRPLDRDREPTAFLRECVVPAVALALRERPERVVGLGVALPGTLRPEEGLCLFSTALGWENVAVAETLSNALEMPVSLVNDIRANYDGERVYGAGQGIDNLFCLTAGRGIEGALGVGGQLYKGDTDSAGEIGHLTVELDGLACACGNQGCLQTVASTPAVARMAAEAIRLGAQSVLSEWASETNPVTCDLVERAALEGDALALKVFDAIGRYLGLALSSVITLVNPRRIVIGGPLATSFDLFAPALLEEVRKRARMVPRDYTEIVATPLKQQAALLGAAWHALEARRGGTVTPS